VRNAGVMAASGRFTDTLPAGLEPVADSAWSRGGDAALGPRGLAWSGVLAPGSAAVMGYRARVVLPRHGARLIDRAEAADQLGRRVVAWAEVRVASRSYLPLVRKGAP